MRKFALVALAAVFAASGAVLPASASLSDRDSTVWKKGDLTQVAARGDKGGRNDGGRNGGKSRDARNGKKDSKVIWRIRDKHHRPFFLFRGRGDCRTESIQVRDGSGNFVIRQGWVCN